MSVVRVVPGPSRILGWILAALLLAAGSRQLLAQQPDPGGAVFRDCAACPEMVAIPPGSITVGAAEGGAGAGAEEQPRSVAISSAIGIGRYEVTRAQFARFVRETGHETKRGCFVWNGVRYEQDASRDWRNPGFTQTEDDPVVCVNWNDAKAYTEWLSRKSQQAYRLPTEAEWEYAARAGSRALRPWGDDARVACRYANAADVSTMRNVPGTTKWLFHDCDDRHAYTAPAGSYQANAFGLYDMLGNAWEWTEGCQDEEDAGVPSGDRDCTDGACCRRVLRGGGWVDSPLFVRYDFRFLIRPGDSDFYIGFRVARTI